jgi:hypothetical protein
MPMNNKAASGSFSRDGPAGTIDPHTHDGSGRFGGLELDLAYATLVAP